MNLITDVLTPIVGVIVISLVLYKLALHHKIPVDKWIARLFARKDKDMAKDKERVKLEVY
jgi:hypothetical protein